MLDLAVILGYFAVVLAAALWSRLRPDAGVDEYFVAGRRLGWWSIAASTIATNLQAGHFLAVIGSAYAFGLAQANFELNAVLGLVLAAFVFVPLYLRARVVTISEYLEQRLGGTVATAYAVMLMVLYGTLYLGAALFWGGYCLEVLFGPQLGALVGGSPGLRIAVMIVLLGGFSALYTRQGGLGAVVRTDVVQFVLLMGGGLTVLVLAVRALGGWGAFPDLLADRMHLHLPNSHPKLPWLGIATMHLLNLQYWGCNQVILQRALGARSLRDAQVGLLVGGAFKFLTAAMLVLPGIALVGILGRDHPLGDPDQAYLRLVDLLLAPGVRGLVLCGLFASLMSSVDSIFNSVSTVWSVDIYRRRLRPAATERQVVAMGRRAVGVTCVVGIVFGFAFAWVKLRNPDFPLDPVFKQVSYNIKNGLVVLVAATMFLGRPRPRLVLGAMLAMVPLSVLLDRVLAQVPYLIVTGAVITSGLLAVFVPTALERRAPGGPARWRPVDRRVGAAGVLLVAVLAAIHVRWH
ncbi:MAG: sodium/solute symporter [Candidatus Krumholzibacteriia bacterium]